MIFPEKGSICFSFSMMPLKRQHSKKGNFVSSSAGLLEETLDIASWIIYTVIVVDAD